MKGGAGKRSRETDEVSTPSTILFAPTVQESDLESVKAGLVITAIDMEQWLSGLGLDDLKGLTTQIEGTTKTGMVTTIARGYIPYYKEYATLQVPLNQIFCKLIVCV